MAEVPHTTNIPQERPPLKVAPYENIAYRKTWMGRSKGLWGTAAAGAAYGGLLVGPAMAMIPVLTGVVGLDTAITSIPGSMAIFGAAGMSAGFAAGAAVGAPAGAAAAVAEEQERRMRERDIALGISTPEKEAEITRMQEAEPDGASAWSKFTTINPKVFATFTLLGMIGGAIMAAAAYATGGMASLGSLPGAGTLLGAAAVTDPLTMTVYSIAATGAFGSLFGLAVPNTVTHMQDHAGGLLSGKRTLGVKGVFVAEPAIGHSSEEPAQPEIPAIQPSGVFSKRLGEQSQSYRDLVRKAENAPSEMLRP